VPMRRLDDLVDAADVDVITPAVEGAELGVLLGAPRLLERCRPLIMFESAPETDVLGYTKEAMYDHLAAKNYALLLPNRLAHNGPGLTRDAFLDGHWYPRSTTNYFAVPEERKLSVRDKARTILNITAKD
jgi:Methyltransferase FkbM domain